MRVVKLLRADAPQLRVTPLESRYIPYCLLIASLLWISTPDDFFVTSHVFWATFFINQDSKRMSDKVDGEFSRPTYLKECVLVKAANEEGNNYEDTFRPEMGLSGSCRVWGYDPTRSTLRCVLPRLRCRKPSGFRPSDRLGAIF